MSELYICKHCHNYLSGKGNYCPNCNSVEKRKETDEANRKNFEENGLVFKCHECDIEKKVA
jgi:RNase P subunit RPR2